MSIPGTHIVHKQTVDVSLTSDRNVTDVQEQLKELLYTRSIPVIEKVLDSMGAQDEHIYIERLEVDMGKLDLSKTAGDILNKLQGELEKKLHELLAENSGNTGGAIDHTGPVDKQNSVSRYTSAQAIKNAFLTYVVRGVLPLNFKHYTIDLLEKEIFGEGEEVIRENLIAELAGLYRQYPHLVKRIVYQFTPSFIDKLLLVNRRFYTVYENTGLQSFHQWLLQKKIDEHFSVPVSHTLSGFLREQLLTFLFNQPGISKKEIIHTMLESLRKKTWFPRNEGEKQKWIKAVQVFPGKHDGVSDNPAENFLWQFLHVLRTADEKPGFEQEQPYTEKNAPEHEAGIKAPSDQPNTVPSASTNKLKEPADKSFSTEYLKSLFGDPDGSSTENEPYYINNAGLVLLTPYMQLFFEEKGLLDDKKFLHEEAQVKAIYLLHELAWGDVQAHEPDLVFNKILCGMPVEMPVPPDIPITDKEKAACEELLNAVIKNWDVLKNTSPQGLREGFLQRNGKLAINESGIKLTVEQDTTDILLARLPWSYNIVKHPWMKQIIYVEWTK